MLWGLLGAFEPAQAAVNYLVLNVSGVVGSNNPAWNTTLSATLTLSSTCSTIGATAASIAYFGVPTPAVGVSYVQGVPFTTVSCVAGVPSSLTLTPALWNGNPAVAPVTLTLGGGSIALPVTSQVYACNSYCTGFYGVTETGILLPDAKVLGAEVGFNNWTNPTMVSVYVGAATPSYSTIGGDLQSEPLIPLSGSSANYFTYFYVVGF